MTSPRSRPAAPHDPRQSALSLVDEAAHRLRQAPAATLAVYYVGTLPFVLALLYFVADMSRSADAPARAWPLSLGLGGLYVAMKIAQAVFAARLRAQFGGRPMPVWTGARLARLAWVQAAWQPSGLFVLSVVSLAIFPTAWAYAFYQNITVCGDGEPVPPGGENLLRRAWRHTVRRPGQNHAGLSVLSGLAFFAWLALLVAAFMLPALLKTFTGEENDWTRSPIPAVFNTTFLAVSATLVFLVIDPWIKTFYALRCFYTDAEYSGEDLLAGLRALPPVGPADDAAPAPAPTRAGAGLTPVLLVAACAFALHPAQGHAASPPSTPASTPTPAVAPARGQTVAPGALDRSLRDVLARREFAWRGPRSARPTPTPRATPGPEVNAPPEERNLLDRLWDWWKSRHPDDGARHEPASSGGGNVIALGDFVLRPLLYVGLAACVLVGLFLLYRTWRARRVGTLAGRALVATAGSALPDLADETVLADQLPEDEWLALARRLLAQGEHRLALRAFYLSALAHLGGLGLLSIARHKTNRDYLNEIRRRARDRAAVPDAFARLVGRFERVWYGSHPADDALLTGFQADRDRLVADTAAPVAPPAVMAVPA